MSAAELRSSVRWMAFLGKGSVVVLSLGFAVVCLQSDRFFVVFPEEKDQDSAGRSTMVESGSAWAVDSLGLEESPGSNLDIVSWMHSGYEVDQVDR